MHSSASFKITQARVDVNKLRIDKRKGIIKGQLAAFRFVDKTTKQVVIYIPALELSGYGKTNKKAEEMTAFSIENCLDYLYNLPIKDVKKELARLGWKQHFVRNHDFSNTHVDVDGNLKNFNAENDIVERIALVA